MWILSYYHKTSNISRTLVGNEIVDNSDVVGASPASATPTTSSFSTSHMASVDWAKTTPRGYKKHLSFGIWCDLYMRFYGKLISLENCQLGFTSVAVESWNDHHLMISSCFSYIYMVTIHLKHDHIMTSTPPTLLALCKTIKLSVRGPFHSVVKTIGQGIIVALQISCYHNSYSIYHL